MKLRPLQCIGIDDVRIELLHLGDDLLEVVGLRRAQMESADDGVHLLDAGHLLRLPHRVDDPDMTAGTDDDQALASQVEAGGVISRCWPRSRRRLPLGIAQGFDVPPSSGITFWLIALFAASIGAPFVALSASAPLLQNWFIATGHPMAKNPYVLYAASNLGSFAGLLAYPFLIEPFFSLQTQTAIWSFAFAVLAIGVCVSAVMAAGGSIAARSASSETAPSALQRLTWMALTAIPSGLCIAVTAYITTDLAAAPFLWVLPLALYLLTFVAVFRDRPWVPHAWVLRLLPYVLTPIAISMLGGDKVYWLAIVLLNLTAFTLMALACHGEAYRLRPEPARLTEFYLWTSFGGVLGGIFAGLIAPNVFNNTYEYPILIVAGLLLLPGIFGEQAPSAPEAGRDSARRSLRSSSHCASRSTCGFRLPPNCRSRWRWSCWPASCCSRPASRPGSGGWWSWHSP